MKCCGEGTRVSRQNRIVTARGVVVVGGVGWRLGRGVSGEMREHGLSAICGRVNGSSCDPHLNYF